jgi:hypothetical protein
MKWAKPNHLPAFAGQVHMLTNKVNYIVGLLYLIYQCVIVSTSHIYMPSPTTGLDIGKTIRN